MAERKGKRKSALRPARVAPKKGFSTEYSLLLTATMILGVLAIVVLLVIRLQAPAGPYLPPSIVLPEGVRATAYTQGTGWIAVVTDTQEILIFETDGHTLRQRIPVVVD